MEYDYEATKATLLDHLRGMPDDDNSILYCGNEARGIKDLIREVEGDTPFGRELVDLSAEADRTVAEFRKAEYEKRPLVRLRRLLERLHILSRPSAQ